jgi:WD40 repeat protein
MPGRLAISLLLTLSALPLGSVRGEPPAGGDHKVSPTDKPRRTDVMGDPLPKGVIARLGTGRLCQPGASFFAFSADGKLLAAASFGKPELLLWEVGSGKELWRAQFPRISGYSPGMRPLAFSPDGKWIAMGCADRSIRLWDVPSGRETRRLECRRPMVHLAFSPDGKALAAEGPDGGIGLWDPAGGQSLGTWGKFQWVGALAFSPDGKTLTALVPVDGQFGAASWDAAKGEQRGSHVLDGDEGYSGTLSPDGALYAVPTRDGKTIRLMATNSNKEVCRTEGEASYPAAVAFSADGRALTATTRDGTVRVWEAATGKLLHRLTGLSSAVDRVALSPDGRVLLTVQRADQAIHLWDVAKGKELHAFPGHRAGPLDVAFSGDGKTVLTASRDWLMSSRVSAWADWSLRRWDPETGKELGVTSRDQKGEVHHCAFSPDGGRLATVLHDGTLRLWDAGAGKELRDWTVPTAETRVGTPDKMEKYAREAISDPVFSGDGRTLWAAAANGVYRWDTATGKELPVLSLGSERSWPRCRPSPDGRVVAVSGMQGSGRGRSRLIDTATGQTLHELAAEAPSAGALAFAPDGRTLAVTSGRDVTLWEVASGRPRGRLTVAPESAFSLAFSPDGRFLALGGDGQAPLRLWDLTAESPTGGSSWPWGRVLSLAFSPDGKRLALAGWENTALVCDVAALFEERPAERLKLSRDDRERLWGDLSGAEAGRAYRALQRLAASGPEGIALLKDRLKELPQPDEKRMARLIKDLDSDHFETRERATQELKGFGPRAEGPLRDALKAGPSAEVRARAEQLLSRLKDEAASATSPELVALRVVEALELNGGAEARVVLEGLAKGTADDHTAAAAKASLGRLTRRPTTP